LSVYSELSSISNAGNWLGIFPRCIGSPLAANFSYPLLPEKKNDQDLFKQYKMAELGDITVEDRIGTKWNLLVRSDGTIFDQKMNECVASITNKVYRHIRVGRSHKTGKYYKVHRLVAMVFIPNPDNKPHVDHIDGNPTNNSFDNLRWCTTQENNRNRLQSRNSTSGFKGVTYHKRDKSWQAQTKIDGKKKHLGYFKTAKEASHAYEEFTKSMFGEFYRPPSPTSVESEYEIDLISDPETEFEIENDFLVGNACPAESATLQT